jgi:hypothetical protein
LELLVEIFIKGMALDEGSVRLGELFAVELDKNGPDVVNELVDP